MPRLNNGNAGNLAAVREWGESYWMEVKLYPEDPGRVPPMDVCYHCKKELELVGDVEHPSYADSEYACAICQDLLDEDDD